MKLLIADSGATKTDWAIIQEGKLVYIRTRSLHPAYMDPKSISRELKSTLGKIPPDIIYFYGAGCYSEEASRPVRELLEELYSAVPVEVYDDLTGAAHAFLGNREGIAGILGTGSASGYFKNGQLVRKIASLGYVLGDEGSSADIGKRLLKALFRDELSRETVQYLETEVGPMEYRHSILKLYRSKQPSYFLARITEKALKGEFPAEVGVILKESFQDYVDVHLRKYEGFPTTSVVLTGGIATSRQVELEEVLLKNDLINYSIRSGIITSLAERKMKKAGL